MRSQCQETMGIGTCMLMATNVYYAVSSHLLSHLILIMTHWGRYSYFSFTDESTYSEYFRISCKEKKKKARGRRSTEPGVKTWQHLNSWIHSFSSLGCLLAFCVAYLLNPSWNSVNKFHSWTELQFLSCITQNNSSSYNSQWEHRLKSHFQSTKSSVRIHVSFIGTYLCAQPGPSVSDAPGLGLIRQAEPTCLICVSAYHLATQDSTPCAHTNQLKLYLQAHYLGWAKRSAFTRGLGTCHLLPSCHVLPGNFLGGPDINFGRGGFSSILPKWLRPRQARSVAR